MSKQISKFDFSLIQAISSGPLIFYKQLQSQQIDICWREKMFHWRICDPCYLTAPVNLQLQVTSEQLQLGLGR